MSFHTGITEVNNLGPDQLVSIKTGNSYLKWSLPCMPHLMSFILW